MKKTKSVINRRMNHRYMIGSLAAVGASSAGAATVQITFANNYVANTAAGGLANFNPDLTGDGVVDGNVSAGAWTNIQGRVYCGLGLVGYTLVDDNIPATAVLRVGATNGASGGSFRGFGVQVGYVHFYGRSSYDISTRVANMVIYFRDSRINSGARTLGWLDVSLRSGLGGQEVRINRLIFDDASSSLPPTPSVAVSYPDFVAVPEPSSLGLLALGAGGLLARRRRAKSAA